MPAVADDLNDADAPVEPTTAFEVPFWQKYNAHFEFPSSVVLSVLTFATAFAVIVGVLLLALAGGKDAKPVPIRMVLGSDNDGDGRAGSGGTDTLLAKGDLLPQPVQNQALPNSTLPDVQSPNPSTTVPNPNQTGPLPSSSSTQLEQLFEALRNGQAGAKRGSGPGEGRGDSGQPGTGPGGTGNDDNHKRSLRWSLRFRSESGRDYVNQLAAMGAVVVIPQPPDERDAVVYRDLKAPKPERLAEGEWTKLATQIQFIDTKPDSVKGVADALGTGFTPKRFLAFFPKDLEERLARLETSYRNRRAEDIEETVFRVTVRGGAYDIVVESQTAKR